MKKYYCMVHLSEVPFFVFNHETKVFEYKHNPGHHEYRPDQEIYTIQEAIESEEFDFFRSYNRLGQRIRLTGQEVINELTEEGVTNV